MAGARLLTFACKPAPIQVSWLAYLGTTGLSAIDYRVTDPHLDPPEDVGVSSEQPLRLPDSFWCYDPLASETVGPLPAKQGQVAFGSLNTSSRSASSGSGHLRAASTPSGASSVPFRRT